jgi:hypothetical protein
MTSAPRTSRRIAAGAALACIAVLSTACGAASGSAAPGATVTVTAVPSVPGSTSPVATAPASTPAAPAGPAACPTRSLGVKIGLSQGTAGSTYTVIDFTNISHVTCTLYGYPGVSLAGGKPVTQIGLAAVENPTPPRHLVTLRPGAVANALLRIVDAGNFPPATCGPKPASYLQIFPPNQTTPIYLGYHTMTCSKRVRILTVNVVQPGSGGSS